MPADFLSRFHVLFYCTLWTQFHLIYIDWKPFLFLFTDHRIHEPIFLLIYQKKDVNHIISGFYLYPFSWWMFYVNIYLRTVIWNPWQETAWSFLTLESCVQNIHLSYQSVPLTLPKYVRFKNAFYQGKMLFSPYWTLKGSTRFVRLWGCFVHLCFAFSSLSM